ncbi:hypothetical protein N9878_02355 [bacterium]|nr:hypothetical protein [bacterium]
MDFAKRMNGVNNKLCAKFDERTGDSRLAILKQGEQVWNPTTARYDTGPDTKYFLTGVQINALAGMVNGTTIQQGDMSITASTVVTDESSAVVSYVPVVNDKMLIDGVQWSIVDAPHVNYAGNDLIVSFKMTVRK